MKGLSCLGADGSLSGTELSSLDLLSANSWSLLFILRPGPLAHVWVQAATALVGFFTALSSSTFNVCSSFVALPCCTTSALPYLALLLCLSRGLCTALLCLFCMLVKFPLLTNRLPANSLLAAVTRFACLVMVIIIT